MTAEPEKDAWRCYLCRPRREFQDYPALLSHLYGEACR